MFVIGTAGHIDHGKSALVKALSGIDPDRLPEEQLRGLTIDLGFAWFDLPNGQPVGVVDVPGHERFIKNMVAGVGAIDAVMLVIAADDGWMPQTSEHLDILSLLEIKTGIVVLSKADLVDKEMLELQKDDITIHLQGTFLANAPIIPFSVKTGAGKTEILISLQEILSENIERKSIDSPRLYIDRSFIVKGMGTVVTGTLLEGEIKLGQELEICPLGIKAKVRGLQTHKQSIEKALPGSRVAVNLTGVDKDDTARGSALVMPSHFEPADTLGIKVEMLPNLKYPLRNAAEVAFLLGTSVVNAKIKLFGKKMLATGENDYAVAHLDSKICCRIGDRFIIRRLSPAITVAGGVVLDWDFGSIKRKKAEQLEILKTRDDLQLGSIIKSELMKDNNLQSAHLRLNSRFTMRDIEQQINRTGDLVNTAGGLIRKEHLDKYIEPIREILKEDHETRSWANGISTGQLAKRIKIPAKELDEVMDYLVSTGEFRKDGSLIRLSSHTPYLNNKQKQLAQKLHAILSASPLAAPVKNTFINEDPTYEIIIDFLIKKGDLVELNNGVLFTKRDYDLIIEKTKSFILIKNKATASEIKDHLNTTRKYVIPLLEEMDAKGITVRDGDYRNIGE